MVSCSLFLICLIRDLVSLPLAGSPLVLLIPGAFYSSLTLHSRTLGETMPPYLSSKGPFIHHSQKSFPLP